MNPQLQGGNVITTNSTPLPQYIKNIQNQIVFTQQQIANRDKQTASDTAKIADLVAKLSALVSA